MEFHVEERIHPQLEYYKDDNPISKLQQQGWELVQLVPEYDVIECDPPRSVAQPNTATLRKISATLEIANFVGIFRR
ncbi:MAG: hypothetical protein AB1716_17600 [Planctomycetota bacterium]